MKHLTIMAISALSLMLAACNQSTESSVSDTPASNTAPSASSTPDASAAANPAQTLTSNNGKISITLNGQFADKLPEASQLISDIPAEQLLLLQRDDSADVLLYAADLGKAKTDAATYLKNLSDAIKADAGLNNVEVGAAKDKQLAYQFSETEADGDINQACQAVHQEHIYSVCAISSSQSAAQLAQLLTNVTVK